MTAGVVRAWIVGHAVTSTLTCLVAVGAVASVYATTMIAGVGARLPIPAWALVPPMLAVFSTLGVVNSLPVLAPPPPQLILARAVWLTVVLLVAAASAELVTIVAGFDGLVEATVLLIGLTYASAVIIGRAAVVVGAGVAVYIVTNTQTYANLSGQDALLYAEPPWHWAGAAVAILGCLGFLWRGGRRGDE